MMMAMQQKKVRCPSIVHDKDGRPVSYEMVDVTASELSTKSLSVWRSAEDRLILMG